MKTKKVIFDVIKKHLLSNCPWISEHEIELKARLTNDLDLDSCELCELIIELQEVYSVTIHDNRRNSWKTINDIVEDVYQLINK